MHRVASGLAKASSKYLGIESSILILIQKLLASTSYCACVDMPSLPSSYPNVTHYEPSTIALILAAHKLKHNRSDPSRREDITSILRWIEQFLTSFRPRSFCYAIDILGYVFSSDPSIELRPVTSFLARCLELALNNAATVCRR